MKIIITFFSIVLAAQISLAQWNRIERIPSTIIFSVHFNGNNIFVGADSLYISRDRGQTWQANLIAGQQLDITTFIQADEKIFAGTYGQGVFLSTDDGHSWLPFNSGLSGFALYAKTFVISGDTIYYGTDGGGVYFLKLLTTVWQSYNQNLPSNYAWTINDLTVTNANILASAGASGFYYLRQKGAPEWTELRIQTPQGTYTTPNVFLSSGDTVFSGSGAGIYRSTDNGYNWDSVGISSLPLNVVSFAKQGSRIFTGYTRPGDFYIWFSDDNGNNWNFMEHEFHFMNHLYTYDDKIWIAADDGLWYKQFNTSSVDPLNGEMSFTLEQNYPNPFNPNTKIRFKIPIVTNNNSHSTFATLKIFDVLGNEIAELFNDEVLPGVYEVEFSAKEGFASGIYFYQLKFDGFVQTKKMILLK